MGKIIYKRGFTLIELLVVVAIIGILASVVLAALNAARTKGADASIKGNLGSIRSQAAIYYENNSASYNTTGNPITTCNLAMYADPTIASAISQITDKAGATEPNCYSDTAGRTYAVAAVLATSGAGTFCVDSSGNGKILSTATNSSATAVGNTTNAILGDAATSYVCQ